METLENEQNADRRNLENVQLRRAACELLQVFDVMAEAFNTLQSDSATIATAAEYWINLADKMTEMNNEQFLSIATKRKTEALGKDCFFGCKSS